MGDDKNDVDNKLAQEDIYEVQEIVGMKKVGDVWLYRVRWKGYGPQSDTWEPESNLTTVWNMIEKYKSKVNKVSQQRTGRRRGRPSIHNNSTTTASVDATVERKENMLSSNPSIKASQNDEQQEQNDCKKRIKLNPNDKKDTFWKDLEEGKIDVFKEDLYSRVKSRSSSRNSSIDNSPKSASKNSDSKSWSQSSNNSSDSSDSSDTIELECNLKDKLTNQLQTLINAIKNSDLELVKILVKNGFNINSRDESHGETPLMVASRMNNVFITNYLLQQGALKDLVDNDGDTALIKACRCGFNDIIKLLLLYGANFAIINKMGINALRIAKENPNKNIRDNLVNYISRLTLSFELQVMNILATTARIVNALFPIQCYSVCDHFSFHMKFKFHQQQPIQSGVGYLLFIANSDMTLNDVKCKLSGPNSVQEVLLNGIPQKPLTEGAKFIFAFSPLSSGENQIMIHTFSPSEKSRIKLLICAYEVMLIDNSLTEQNVN